MDPAGPAERGALPGGVRRDESAAAGEPAGGALASLDTLDDCNRKRARITNELMKQWAMYAQLQWRQLATEE